MRTDRPLLNTLAWVFVGFLVGLVLLVAVTSLRKSAPATDEEMDAAARNGR